MQNIAKIRETLAQIRCCCLEIAHGCEQAETADVSLQDLAMLAEAIHECHLVAEKLVLQEVNSEDAIDPKLDHDGDTQPTNDPPTPPVCRCGHTRNDHMPQPLSHYYSGELRQQIEAVAKAGVCIYCECERFQ